LKKVYLLLLLLVLSVISLFVGVKDISLTEFFRLSDDEALVMAVSRFPRTVAIVLAGVGMSICGLIMQQMLHNKFVSPTIVGSLDAAKMGILFSILLIPQGGTFNKMVFSLVFTFLASLLFIKMTERIKYRNIVFIPLVGIMFGNIINAVSTYFAYQHNIVQNMNAWLIGDFSSVLQGRYEMIYLCLPAIALTYFYANRFTVVGMGEAFSKNLGLNYRATINLGLFCVSLTVSVIMITVGAIPFLGLVIPNIISLLYGDNLKKTLPYTALFGAVFLLLCDILGRLIIFPFEVPIGIMVGVIGGIIFLILLLKKRS
jgi:iron complex transport system permease protein